MDKEICNSNIVANPITFWNRSPNHIKNAKKIMESLYIFFKILPLLQVIL